MVHLNVLNEHFLIIIQQVLKGFINEIWFYQEPAGGLVATISRSSPYQLPINSIAPV
jgi:hypothetical protein